MEQKRTGLSYVFTLARGERGKLGVGMLLAVLCSALSLITYLVVYQILLLIIQNEVTFGAMAMWACIGIAAAIGQAILMSFAGICSHVAAFNTMHKIKVKVLEHISRFNLGFFQERSPGQIKTTLFDDVDRVEQFLAHSTLELAQAIVVPLVLLVGSYLFLGGTIAPDQLVAFMLMSLALSALLIAFEHSYNLLKDLNLAAHNLEQAYDTKPLSYKEEDVKLSHFDIAFEHVDFSYNKQADVLTDISFFAKENSVTALIGPSGSGKSTVANLIARFWDVSKGTIRIGGKDIKDLNPDGLLHYISEVFQENTLLSDTIYNNIKAGRENATEEEIIEAAKAARCHEFIEKLPEGYQTRLSEGGNTLSGGEKQRIAIARAILKNAPILLLDESTASLDADNEAKINQALDRLMKGKTVFVIAHRLNTIQNADQIILLNQGRIEEMGTHTELLAKKGHYYEMVQEQEKAKKWIVKGA